jgi:hypothetical protein
MSEKWSPLRWSQRAFLVGILTCAVTCSKPKSDHRPNSADPCGQFSLQAQTWTPEQVQAATRCLSAESFSDTTAADFKETSRWLNELTQSPDLAKNLEKFLLFPKILPATILKQSREDLVQDPRLATHWESLQQSSHLMATYGGILRSGIKTFFETHPEFLSDPQRRRQSFEFLNLFLKVHLPSDPMQRLRNISSILNVWGSEPEEIEALAVVSAESFSCPKHPDKIVRQPWSVFVEALANSKDNPSKFFHDAQSGLSGMFPLCGASPEVDLKAVPIWLQSVLDHFFPLSDFADDLVQTDSSEPLRQLIQIGTNQENPWLLTLQKLKVPAQIADIFITDDSARLWAASLPEGAVTLSDFIDTLGPETSLELLRLEDQVWRDLYATLESLHITPELIAEWQSLLAQSPKGAQGFLQWMARGGLETFVSTLAQWTHMSLQVSPISASHSQSQPNQSTHAVVPQHLAEKIRISIDDCTSLAAQGLAVASRCLSAHLSGHTEALPQYISSGTMDEWLDQQSSQSPLFKMPRAAQRLDFFESPDPFNHLIQAIDDALGPDTLPWQSLAQILAESDLSQNDLDRRQLSQLVSQIVVETPEPFRLRRLGIAPRSYRVQQLAGGWQQWLANDFGRNLGKVFSQDHERIARFHRAARQRFDVRIPPQNYRKGAPERLRLTVFEGIDLLLWTIQIEAFGEVREHFSLNNFVSNLMKIHSRGDIQKWIESSQNQIGQFYFLTRFLRTSEKEPARWRLQLAQALIDFIGHQVDPDVLIDSANLTRSLLPDSKSAQPGAFSVIHRLGFFLTFQIWLESENNPPQFTAVSGDSLSKGFSAFLKQGSTPQDFISLMKANTESQGRILATGWNLMVNSALFSTRENSVLIGTLFGTMGFPWISQINRRLQHNSTESELNRVLNTSKLTLQIAQQSLRQPESDLGLKDVLEFLEANASPGPFWQELERVEGRQKFRHWVENGSFWTLFKWLSRVEPTEKRPSSKN